MSDMPNQTPSDETTDKTIGRIDRALETIAAVRAGVGGAILGQERVIDLTLATILAGGHGLLVGAPGLAKTRLVEAVAIATGLDWGRVQFTPDLMPSDIIGSEILDQDSSGKRNFRFVRGPVFTSLLMADEINRASPRTQSALLQAMQEGQVTVSGVTYSLPEPFFVLATQNPIEQEGTYPLPEAQLDRFLLQIDVPFPDRETERQVLLATTGDGDLVAKAALKPG
ncbi:MAG: AAA family ATPase, partial [Hyphomonadaceae bacterium]